MTRGTRQRRQFEALVKPQLAALYRTARRMTGDEDLARDMVQEACMKAYEFFDRYAPGTNFRAWIFRILKNTILDSMRRRDRAPFAVMSSADYANLLDNSVRVSDHGSEPDRVLQRKSFLADTVRAFDQLPSDIRMVMSLALIDELSYAEIALILDCPVGTVRSRLNRGRHRMREMLAEHFAAASGDEPIGLGVGHLDRGSLH